MSFRFLRHPFQQIIYGLTNPDSQAVVATAARVYYKLTITTRPSSRNKIHLFKMKKKIILKLTIDRYKDTELDATDLIY